MANGEWRNPRYVFLKFIPFSSLTFKIQLVISMVSPIQLQVQEMDWYPPARLVLSLGHTVGFRRDGIVQFETWPSIHSQSGRMSHESSNSSGALYPESPRIRTNQLSDDSQRAVTRREHESMAANFLLRYPTFGRSSRTSGLCNMYTSRETTDVRDPRRCSHGTQFFLVFLHSRISHNQPTYSSFCTSIENNLMTTPTVHSIAMSSLFSDGFQVLTNLRKLMVTVILDLKKKLGKDRIFFGSCLAKYVLMRYYIYFVLYVQLFYLYISSSITMYHSTPSCLHIQTAAASQPRHHFQHDGQELPVQRRAIRLRMRKRHCRRFLGRR